MVPSDFALVLDASDEESIVVGSGATVSQWRDLSGNERHADHVSGGSATWDGEVVEWGLSTRFRGILSVSGVPSPVIPPTGDWVICVRGAATGPRISQSFFGVQTIYTIEASFSSRVILASVGSDQSLTPLPNRNLIGPALGVAERTITFSRTGNDFHLRVDGVQVASVSEPSTREFPTVNYWVGTRHGSDNSTLEGYLRRILVYHGTGGITMIEKIAEQGFATDTGPVLSGPHATSHLDRSQLLSSPNLLRSFP